MRPATELVEYIRLLCKEDKRDISLTKLEELFGWANGTIGKWAKGKRYPPLDKLQKIADFFNIKLSELTGQKEKPASDGDELLDAELIRRLSMLTNDEMKQVDAFVQGLLAARSTQPSPHG